MFHAVGLKVIDSNEIRSDFCCQSTKELKGI